MREITIPADTFQYLDGDCFTMECETEVDAAEVCRMYDGTIMLKQVDIDHTGKKFDAYVNLTPKQAEALIEALRSMSANVVYEGTDGRSAVNAYRKAQ